MNTNISELLEERTFLTPAGTETYLLFQQKFNLPEFCAFVVYEDEEAWEDLERNYLHPIFQAAATGNFGLMLDALVWRAHPDYLARLGRDPQELGPINERAVSRTRASIARWRQTHGHDDNSLPTLVAANIGPRGDGYRVENSMITSDDAREYHRLQLPL